MTINCFPKSLQTNSLILYSTEINKLWIYTELEKIYLKTDLDVGVQKKKKIFSMFFF